MKDNIKIKMPDFLVKMLTGRYCEHHPAIETHYINDHEVCGECELERAQKRAIDKRNEYIVTHQWVLQTYYGEKNEKRK